MRLSGPAPLLEGGYLMCAQCGVAMRPKLMREEFPNWEDDRIIETVTLVGFSSPEGHKHDDNCWKRPHVCANGHEVTVSKRMTCPTCDWKGKTACDCHDYDKLDEWPTPSLVLEGACA